MSTACGQQQICDMDLKLQCIVRQDALLKCLPTVLWSQHSAAIFSALEQEAFRPHR